MEILEYMATELEKAGGAAEEVKALRRRVVDLWIGLDRLYPGSAYIERRLRQAKAAAVGQASWPVFFMSPEHERFLAACLESRAAVTRG